MPEVVVHYSENLPSEDHSYKTRRFTSELHQQVPDTADITAVTQRLFMVAKANVQSQVERAKSDLALGEPVPFVPVVMTAPVLPEPQKTVALPPRTNHQSKPASQKQVSYLLRLARKAGLKDANLRALPERFNKDTFDELTSSEASALIDDFSMQKAA